MLKIKKIIEEFSIDLVRALTSYGITTAWVEIPKDLQNKRDMINGIDDPPKD